MSVAVSRKCSRSCYLLVDAVPAVQTSFEGGNKWSDPASTLHARVDNHEAPQEKVLVSEP